MSKGILSGIAASDSSDAVAGGVSDIGEPVKPGLPLLLVAALAFWLACAAVYTACAEMPETPLAVLAVGACVVAGAAGVVLLVARRARVALCVVLGLAIGVACGCVGSYAVERSALLADQAASWSVVLAEDAAPGTFGSSALAHATRSDGAQAVVLVRFDDEAALLRGDSFSTSAEVREPAEKSASFYRSQGCALTMDVPLDQVQLAERTPIVSLRSHAIDAFARYGGDRTGVLQALICGYTPTLEESGAYEAFQTTGLAHIVAVSGSHLTLVTLLFGWALRRARLPHGLYLAAVSLFMIGYLVFSGVPLSAVRATFMALLTLLATGGRRRASSLNALGLCLFALIALDPPTAVSASFFLSAASTLGVVLFGGLVSSWLANDIPVLRACVEPLGLTVASSLVTLPYSAALFSQVPLVSPLANVAAAPLFTIGCAVGLVAALVSCIAPAAPAAVGLAAAAVTPLQAVADTLARVPFACVPADVPVIPAIALSALACTLLWVLWPRPGLPLLAGAAFLPAAVLIGLLVFAPYARGDEIVMLDVGQGDSFLIRSEGKSLLVDTGNQDALLRKALARNQAISLDAAAITHADDDHCGSLDALGYVARPGAVLLARDALACPCDSCGELRSAACDIVGSEGLSGLAVGDVVRVGKFTLEVIWPHGFSEDGGNADSLCFLVAFDANGDGQAEWRAFFGGDAEAPELEQMVEAGALGRVDVLKVGHHGSKNALTDELAATLCPAISLVSVGADNRYGHPRADTIGFLEECGSRVLRTDVSGDVRLAFSADRITVAVQR